MNEDAFKKIEAILNESRPFVLPEIEKNIFSLGGYGHYENPISDLLAFFINPEEVHGLKDLVLKSINEVAGFCLENTFVINAPKREVVTEDDKRIDILIDGVDFVTIIENKIRHVAINPFDSYDIYLKKKFKDKTFNRLLLSVRKEEPPNNDWKSITYNELIKCIKKNLGQYLIGLPYSKWVVLFREFLLNIEQDLGVDSMADKRFEFVSKYYKEIKDIEKMMKTYKEDLLLKCKTAMQDLQPKGAKLEGWCEETKEGHLRIRLKFSHWGNTNITLMVKEKSSGYSLQLYIYEFTDERFMAYVREILDYNELGIESKTIGCFGHFKNENLDAILNEIKSVAKKVNLIFENNLKLAELKLMLDNNNEPLDNFAKPWLYESFCLVYEYNFTNKKVRFELFVRPAGWILTLHGLDALSDNFINEKVQVLQWQIKKNINNRLVLSEWPPNENLNIIKDDLLTKMKMVIDAEAKRNGS